MSSYIVDKEVFMRAAGLIAGIQDYKRDHLIYDYKLEHWMRPEDFREKFEYFYDLNVLSVVEQYNDKDMEGTPPTKAQCNRIFTEYRIKGKHYMLNQKSQDVIMHLRNFFACVMYQTEKEAYYFEMMMFFDRLLVALMPYLHKAYILSGWTSLDNI